MKKRISLIVALVLVLTNLLSIAAFANFKDVSEESQYRKGIITLTKLGVINGYDDGTFRPEGEITRAEFTKMIMTALGRANTGAVPTEFSDVGEHWAKSFIKSAYDIGIINGFEDGTFRPDDQVTYEQALKMTVCALGYVDFAEDKGGYPGGYVAQANTLKLTEGVTGQQQTAPALRQVIAQVVYNALEVEKREQNRKGEWAATGKTILADDLGMTKLTGTVVGVEEVTTENCLSTLLKYQMAVKTKSGEEIIIDTREYADMTISALQNYLGIEVTVYYDRDSDEKYLRIFDAETIKNATQTITYDDISSYNGATLKYFEGDSGKEKSKTVKAADVTVVYNGETLNENDTYPVVSKEDGTTVNADGKSEVLDYLLNEGAYKIYGDITLTDSGADGTVDMVTINDYRWMIAHKAVSSTNYTVQNTLVTTDTLVIDPDEPDYKIYVEKNGKEVAPTAISKGDVLTYTKSFDGTIIKVYAGKETVQGKVSSMRDDEITIGTKVYNLDPRCIEFIQSKANKTLEVGNTVTAYLDKMDTVVYAEVSAESAAPYAYIASAIYEVSEDALYITAYIPSVSKSSASTYQLADKVRVNGRTYQSDDEVYYALQDALEYNNPDSDDDELTSQVARIKLDSSRKITEIAIIDGDEEGSNSDTTKIVRGADYASYTYSSNKFKLGDATKFSVNSSTIFIDVPADRTAKNNYATRTISYFTNNSSYRLEAFDINENNYAGLVVRYTTGDNKMTAPYYDTAFSIVGGNLGSDYDEEEDTTVTSVPMYINSIKLTSKLVLEEDEDEFEDLSKGDVIQYSYDSEGRIGNLKYVIKYEDIEEVLAGEDYDWSETVTQTSANRWQKYKFDFKYPKAGASATDDYYELYSTREDIARSRVAMFNVLRIEDDKLHVTKDGFVDGVLEPSDYEYVEISASTPIIKAVYDNNGNLTKFTEFGEDGSTKLSIEDFKDAQTYGLNCSKILVATNKSDVKMIVIY